MNFRFAPGALLLWMSRLLPAGDQVIPPSMKYAPGALNAAVAPPAPTKAWDSARSESLRTDTKVLRRIDSLWQANTSRLEQISSFPLHPKSSTFAAEQ